MVAYDEGQPRILEKALVLKDAISDLPHVCFISIYDPFAIMVKPIYYVKYCFCFISLGVK